METDPVIGNSSTQSSGNKCGFCGKTFESLKSLKAHKLSEHSSNVVRQKFVDGKCERSSEDCLFKHEFKETPNGTPKETAERLNEDLVFHFPRLNPFPPDQAEMIMKTLQMVLQKMELMEKVLQTTQS